MALQLGRVVLKYSTYKYHTIMAKTQVLAQGIRVQAAVATAISGQEILDSGKFATKVVLRQNCVCTVCVKQVFRIPIGKKLHLVTFLHNQRL